MAKNDRGRGGKGGKKSLIPWFRRNSASSQDRDLKQSMQRLDEQRNNTADMNEALKKHLGLPHDRSKGVMSMIVRKFVPKKLVPDSMVGLLDEEDALDLVARLMRERVGEQQGAIRDIAGVMKDKREEIDQLKADIEEAIEKDWSAKELQEFIVAKIDIGDLYEEVADLLDEEFRLITPEDREARKVTLLVELQKAVEMGEELMETMSQSCSAGLGIFHQLAVQLFQFNNFQRPTQAVQRAASASLGSNDVMVNARDALQATLQLSFEAMDVALDAAKLVDRYSIASDDMAGLLRSGQDQIRTKVKALRAPQADARKRLPKRVGKDEAGEEAQEQPNQEEEN